jgi:hypothetical protein
MLEISSESWTSLGVGAIDFAVDGRWHVDIRWHSNRLTKECRYPAGLIPDLGQPI